MSRIGLAMLAAAGLAADLWITPAIANWQYTTWGMSQSQLAAISPNIEPTSSAEEEGQSNPYVGRARLKAGYIADDLRYTVYFWFQSDKLVAVSLKPEDETRGPAVVTRLESVYGKPFSNDRQRKMGCETKIEKWRSEHDGNVVRFDQSRCYSVKDGSITLDTYSVRYEPLLTSKGTGL